jgi:hypothetical protein
MKTIKKVTIKFKDEISPIIKKINNNLKQANKLFYENKKLLAKIIKGSFEIG